MQYAYKPEELERLKKTEMEVLAAFIEICEKHDLPYFVNGHGHRRGAPSGLYPVGR